MALTAGLLNLLIGLIYVVIGTMITVDLEKEIRQRGYSHFGVAWLTIMYTCGAHHLVHGVHLTAEGRGIGALDVLAVGIGVPAGVVWSALRIEARRGGRGDRYIPGTPTWLRWTAVGYALTAVAIVALSVPLISGGFDPDPRLIPNVLIAVLYTGIGVGLWRGQLRNRDTLGGWSLSGLSLMMIFPTCAIMHALYVVYSGSGYFFPDYHGLWADWLSVPAALYFFWVVAGLETGTVRDWNEKFEAIEDLSAEHADLGGTSPERVGA